MPVPFGFSVGDFISVCILIKDVVQALDSSSGSSAEYQEVIRELWALDRALLEVVNLAQNFEMTVELNALSHTARRTADQCLHCIKAFMVKIQAYQKPLSEGSSRNLLRDVKGKMTWALLKRDDLQKFRTEINAHSSAINMLLITASVSLTRLSHAKTQQRFEDAQRASECSTQQHLTLMGQVKDTLGEQSRNLKAQGDTITRLADGVNYFFGLGTELKSLMSHILTFSIHSYNVLLNVQDRLSPEVQPNWAQEPITLTDALGRVAPIHLELINNWDILDSVLEARFKNVPGERKIRQKEYALQDRSSKQDIRRDVPFNLCFLPGRRIDMCVLFEDNPCTPTSCPTCCWESTQDFATGGTCEQCGMWFQRVEGLEPVEDHLIESSYPMQASPLFKTTVGERKNGVLNENENLHSFKRVRLLSKHYAQHPRVAQLPIDRPKETAKHPTAPEVFAGPENPEVETGNSSYQITMLNRGDSSTSIEIQLDSNPPMRCPSYLPLATSAYHPAFATYTSYQDYISPPDFPQTELTSYVNEIDVEEDRDGESYNSGAYTRSTLQPKLYPLKQSVGHTCPHPMQIGLHNKIRSSTFVSGFQAICPDKTAMPNKQLSSMGTNPLNAVDVESLFCFLVFFILSAIGRHAGESH